MMTVPPHLLLWFGGFGGAKVGIKGTWSTTRSAFLSHSHQIIKSEVNFFFKYYRGLNIYLELIFVTHNQWIRLYTHTKTLRAVLSGVVGLQVILFPFEINIIEV